MDLKEGQTIGDVMQQYDEARTIKKKCVSFLEQYIGQQNLDLAESALTLHKAYSENELTEKEYVYGLYELISGPGKAAEASAQQK